MRLISSSSLSFGLSSYSWIRPCTWPPPFPLFAECALSSRLSAGSQWLLSQSLLRQEPCSGYMIGALWAMCGGDRWFPSAFLEYLMLHERSKVSWVMSFGVAWERSLSDLLLLKMKVSHWEHFIKSSFSVTERIFSVSSGLSVNFVRKKSAMSINLMYCIFS